MALNRLASVGAVTASTGSLTALNQTVGSEVDAQYLQSVSVQVGGTFSAVLTFEISNDGANWISKSLTSSVGSFQSTVGAASLFSGDVGARYFRVRASSFTSGTATVNIQFSAFSLVNPTAAGTMAVSGTVTANPGSNAEQLETVTALGANVVYTGVTRDMGTTVNARATILRPTIMHNASVNPGTLILEESTDGVTWRETRRTPVPSDTSYRSFEWPLHMRYYRLRFLNGPTAQSSFYLNTLRVSGEGGTMDSKNNLSFLLNTTALTASQAWVGPTLDLGDNHIWNTVRCRVNLATASTTATVRIESSHDGTTWAASTAATTTTTTAGIVAIERPVTERYLRLTVTNGATAQASNQMSLALISL